MADRAFLQTSTNDPRSNHTVTCQDHMMSGRQWKKTNNKTSKTNRIEINHDRT